jgi:hypothetical protein
MSGPSSSLDVSKLYVDSENPLNINPDSAPGLPQLCAWVLLSGRTMNSTICLAPWSSSQLDTLWRSFCSDLYVYHLSFGHSVDREPCVDVYSYNFPNDRLALKLLGEYSTFVGGFNSVMSIISLFYLSTGDRSNSLDGRRPPLLVHRGIWRCGTPQDLSFCSY